MKKIILLLIAYTLFLTPCFAQGTWTAVKNLAPISAGGGAVLLTDGRVMCKGYYSGAGFPLAPDSSWMVLTPDAHGSYANGTWTVISPEHDTRSVFASQVLPTGNVYIAGGEHGSGGSSGELYNTATNTWTYIPNVPGWGIADGNSELLYDGTVMQGCALIYNPDTTILVYDPATGKLNAGLHSIGSQEETSWLKLPDSSILFVNTISDSSERYIPQLHKWVADANVPVSLYDPSSEETGPATLLPNGKAFFIGDVGYTAIYTPSGNASPGTWTTGPNEPMSASHVQLGSWDGPCAAMVNGKVLYSISALASESLPSYFYEYDYVSNTFNQVGAPGGGDSVETQTNMMTMLDLPDGTVLFAYTDSTKFYIYTPSGPPIPQGEPVIDGLFPDSCNRYMVTGKLFNGISEGAAFGDDWQMFTNYPIFRLTSGTNVYYARSFNWNRLGAVQTDSAEDTAYFTLPSLPGGTYSLVVTANGFASSPVSLTTYGVSITSTNITSCHGTGTATASASYGTKPYTYLWSPSGGTDSIASGLSGGTYTVSVTEVGGCSASASVTITTPGTITIAKNSKSVSCHGGNNGSASAIAGGGLLPYTYSWSNGATTSSITGLTAGIYSVTVSDSCGYVNTASITVVQPDSLSVQIKVVIDEHCNGDSTGRIKSLATGGSGLYTFSWNPGGANTSDIVNLTAGTYTVTVMDSCGATVTASATVTQPTPLMVKLDSVNVTKSDPCNGGAKAIVSGGTAPYTYKWLPNGQTIDSIYNQCSGAYCCTVTDNSGCSKSVCIVINNATGVENISASSAQVTVYPNPSNGKITVESSVVSGQATVEVYNMLGEKIYSEQWRISNGQWTIDLSANANGIYLYRVIMDTGDLVGEGKFVIQR